ncbi:hypothetical protein [Photobacterium kagoshimensis]|uniref:hypothetical protein n=1 Tax=Photobacterium kagoshimensis TaxID=2910242 RepID=UPI003D104681
MIKNKAFQAISMGMLLAFVSAFMPSLIETIKKMIADYSHEDFATVGFGSVSAADLSFSVVYLLLFFSTAFMGYKWERNSEKELSSRKAELDEKINAQTSNSKFIMDYLHTMPPQKYLAQFETTYLGLRITLSEIKEFSDDYYENEPDLVSAINKCEGLICQMNEWLIRITKQWDTQGTVFDPSIEYRVNVMAYCKATDAVEKFKSNEYQWKHSERFFMASTPEGIVTDIDGVLFVDGRLDIHYTENQGVFNLTEKRTPIALPVTATGNNSNYPNQNLPGASKAFATGETQYIECCKSAIHEEIDMMEHISSFMQDELKLYYGEGNFAQSIISFPLQRAGEKPYGVLNLYRNKNHLAKRNEYDFMALMKPIIVTISEAIYELYLLRSDLEEKFSVKVSSGEENGGDNVSS